MPSSFEQTPTALATGQGLIVKKLQGTYFVRSADCTHLHEPGCAVKAAVAAGQIAERRYRSYLRLQGDST